MIEAMKKAKWICKYSLLYIHSIIFIVLLGIISSIITVYQALVMKNLIDSATSVHINNMLHYLLIYAITIISTITIECVTSIISTKSYTKLCNIIQKKIYSGVLNAQWEELSKFHSGDITTRITSDAEAITTMILNIFPNILSSAVLLIGSLITLFKFNHILPLIALLFSPPIILLTKHYSRKLKNIYLLIQQNESKCLSLLNESIQNVVIIKSFCLQVNNIKTLKKLQREKLSLASSQNNLNIFNSLSFAFGSYATFFLVFTWGAFNLSSGAVTYGTLSALLQLFGNIRIPFSTLASSVSKSIATLASVERLMQLEKFTPDINNDLNTLDNNVSEIIFDNVSFNYSDNKQIFSNLSIKINKGETVAIIGPSGEGKTTLIRLLLALIYPNDGHIYINNNDSQVEVDAGCRELISYVPQGNTLFSGTIADNLRYGNKLATDDDLKLVTSATCSLDFINELSEGFNTVIGERGLGLSEGQAQRLAVSRALLKKASILILDEATSSLDTETELKVLQTIKNLEHKPICLIITHRPSALAICNRVLKLENGHLSDVTNSL